MVVNCGIFEHLLFNCALFSDNLVHLPQVVAVGNQFNANVFRCRAQGVVVVRCNRLGRKNRLVAVIMWGNRDHFDDSVFTFQEMED